MEFVEEFLKLGDELVRANIKERAKFLQKIDLSFIHFVVVSVLYYRKQCTVGDVAKLLGLRLNTASAILNSLEKKGLVVRKRSSVDRRKVIVCLSQKGCRFFENIRQRRREILKRILSQFTQEEQVQILNLLKKFAQIRKKILEEENAGY